MLIIIFLIPFLTSILLGLAGRHFGQRGTQWLVLPILSIVLLKSLSLFNQYLTTEINAYYVLATWMQTAGLTVYYDFIFDALSVTMLLVVLGISAIVHAYSTDYLKSDPHFIRFFLYLLLFTCFMLVLVLANDFVLLFVGWEGVGIFSYLLINFWYTRMQANKSAMKAVFANKVGDISLLLGLVVIYFCCGSTSFDVVFALVPYMTKMSLAFGPYTVSCVSAIAAFLLIGAVGKSAQLGLHVWLPDAMEGPTPVSALLHAATMVTAGVFLLIRCSVIFEAAPGVLFYVGLIGALTSFFAATIGLFQYDIKRIIAFSTCSQLGYMFVACALSQYNTALFHLFNHAFFKALLFLTAGCIIHALHDEQDIRKMGALHYYLPLPFAFFTIASLSLMGLPFLSGFYSKDLIIEYAGSTFFVGSSFFNWLLLAAAFFTALYSARVLYLVFLAKPNFLRVFYVSGIFDSPATTQLLLIVLALASIFSGYYFSDVFVGFGTTFFANSLTQQAWMPLFEPEFLPFWQKLIPFIGSLFALYVYFMYATQLHIVFYTGTLVPQLFLCVARMANQKWFFDKIYNTLFYIVLKRVYFDFYVFLDKGIIELFGPTGAYCTINTASWKLTRLQDGFLFSYFSYILASFVGIVFYLSY